MNLIHGDCFEKMADMADNSVDLVLCDLPYGIINWTNPYNWDKFLDLEKLFEEYLRITKSKAAIVLFGTEPYSSYQRNKGGTLFKYDIYWIKNKQSSPMFAKVKPLRSVEVISVFSNGTTSPGRKNNMPYNPQGLKPLNKTVKNSKKDRMVFQSRPSTKEEYVQKFTNYPKDYVMFNCESGLHPTQKPVDLMRYLIRTYSNEGEVVLDNCMGSGTTGVACKLENRNFIGIESDENYFNIAKKRIEDTIIPSECGIEWNE